MFKISQFFDENPWRNKSSKLNIFGPLFSKTHSALEAGADPNSVELQGSSWTCLMIAAAYNRAEVVSLLLEQPTTEVNRRGGFFNETALAIACGNNSEASLRRLLSANGLDVNLLDRFNWSPIMVAVRWNLLECVRVLSAVAEVSLDCKYPDGESLEER